MSDRTTGAAESPYPRENYWGGLDRQDESTATSTARRDPNDPAERVAFQLLRETATILVLLGPLFFAGELVGPTRHVDWRQIAVDVAGAYFWYTVAMLVIRAW